MERNDDFMKKLDELIKEFDGKPNVSVDDELVITGEETRPYEYIATTERSSTRTVWDEPGLVREVRGYDTTKVLHALPVKILRIDRPFDDGLSEPLYTIQYQSNRETFLIEQKPLSEHFNYLKNNAYMHSGVTANNIVGEFFSRVIGSELTERRKGIGVRGVWYDTEEEKVIIEDETHIKPDIKDVREAYKELTEFLSYYPKRRIGQVLLWHFVAPFGFIRKQLLMEGYEVDPVPILYLFGSSRTGKTTVERTLLRLYHSHQDLALFAQPGASAVTPYGVGERLSATTYPQLLDEAAGCFNYRTEEVWKSSIMTLVARRVWRRTGELTIPAYSTVALTSNDYNPGYSDALSNRLFEIDMTHNYSHEDRKMFSDFFNTRFSPKKLRLVGCMVVEIVRENPELLFTRNWFEMGREIISIFNDEVEAAWGTPEIPDTPETSHNFSDTVRLLFHEYLSEEVMRNRSRSYTDYTDGPYPRSRPIYTMEDIAAEYKYVLSHNLIRGVYYARKYGERPEMIKITSAFMKNFTLEKGIKVENLLELSDHLGSPWEYKDLRVEKVITTGMEAPLDRVVSTLVDMFHTTHSPEETKEKPIDTFLKGLKLAGREVTLQSFIETIESLPESTLEEIKESFIDIKDEEVFDEAERVLDLVEKEFTHHILIKGVLEELRRCRPIPKKPEKIPENVEASNTILQAVTSWDYGGMNIYELLSVLEKYPDNLALTEDCKDALLNLYMKRANLKIGEQDLITLENKLRRWLHDRV